MRTLLALDAVQPVGSVVRPSKSVQISASPGHAPAPELELLDEELLELLDEELLDEELLELEDELLELEELELLDEELLELDDELVELDPVPPQAARAQDARMTGINLRMLELPQLFLCMDAANSAVWQAAASILTEGSTGASWAGNYFNDYLPYKMPGLCELPREIQVFVPRTSGLRG